MVAGETEEAMAVVVKGGAKAGGEKVAEVKVEVKAEGALMAESRAVATGGEARGVAMVGVGLEEALEVTTAMVEAMVAALRAAVVAAVPASVGRVEVKGVAKVAAVRVGVAKAGSRHANRSQDSQCRIRSYQMSHRCRHPRRCRCR